MGPTRSSYFLEAAAEDIIFGGWTAPLIPADIDCGRNHMFRPMNWKPEQPDFVGGPMVTLHREE